MVMFSNERSYGNRSSSHHSHGSQSSSQGHKGSGQEETLQTTKVQIERKTFVFTLKENPRGRFVRITEDVGGRRDTIIIPSTGLEDFRKAFEEMMTACEDIPPKLNPDDLI